MSVAFLHRAYVIFSLSVVHPSWKGGANRLISVIWWLNPFSSTVSTCFNWRKFIRWHVHCHARIYVHTTRMYIWCIWVLPFIFVPRVRSCYPLSHSTRFVCTRKQNTQRRVLLIHLRHRRLWPTNKFCRNFLWIPKNFFCLHVPLKTNEHKIIHDNNRDMRLDKII